jgi:hypothetical protein
VVDRVRATPGFSPGTDFLIERRAVSTMPMRVGRPESQSAQEASQQFGVGYAHFIPCLSGRL